MEQMHINNMTGNTKKKNIKKQNKSDVKVMGSSPVQSKLCTLQLTLSKVVGKTVTETVSTEPTVENNFATCSFNSCGEDSHKDNIHRTNR